MAEKKKSKKEAWLWVCGCGCAFLLVLGLIGAAVLGFIIWFGTTEDIPDSVEGPVEITVIDDWLSRLNEKGHFNGGILIVREGKPVLKKVYGSKDPDGKIPLTLQSSFRLASVSKHVTAMAVMVLHEDGELDFDDPISKFLPEIGWEGVTIRHLLNHTSGAPDYMGIPSRKYSKDKPLSIDAVVEYMGATYPQLQATPGEQFEYSNTGYVLLAAIVGRASESSFEQFVSDRIFGPLGMKHSRVWNLLSDNPHFPTRTEGFSLGEMELPGWLDGVSGDGGVFVSVEDFVIWEQALREHRLVSKRTMQIALTPPKLGDGQKGDYGFGWVLSDSGQSYSHSGSWLAAGTFIFQNPSRKEFLVILDNSGNRMRIDYIADELIEALEFEE